MKHNIFIKGTHLALFQCVRTDSGHATGSGAARGPSGLSVCCQACFSSQAMPGQRAQARRLPGQSHHAEQAVCTGDSSQDEDVEAASDSASSHQAVEQLLRPGIVHRLDKGTTGASTAFRPDHAPLYACLDLTMRSCLKGQDRCSCRVAEDRAEVQAEADFELLCSDATTTTTTTKAIGGCAHQLLSSMQ